MNILINSYYVPILFDKMIFHLICFHYLKGSKKLLDEREEEAYVSAKTENEDLKEKPGWRDFPSMIAALVRFWLKQNNIMHFVSEAGWLLFLNVSSKTFHSYWDITSCSWSTKSLKLCFSEVLYPANVSRDRDLPI